MRSIEQPKKGPSNAECVLPKRQLPIQKVTGTNGDSVTPKNEKSCYFLWMKQFNSHIYEGTFI